MQRIKTKAPADDEKAWDTEIQAVKNIKEGKVKMETQTAKAFLAELKELENEP
jgi:hypothetical protein